VRDRSSTVIWKRYCGTAAKAGGNGENKLRPAVTGDSCLLEITGMMGLEISSFNLDGFVKSPSAALRCIPCPVKLKAAISRDMG
jgi:hypothetical protein